jgi:hypothetical protein
LWGWWGGVVRGAKIVAGLVVLGVPAVLGGGCSIMPTSGPEIGEVHRGGNPEDPERLPLCPR